MLQDTITLVEQDLTDLQSITNADDAAAAKLQAAQTAKDATSTQKSTTLTKAAADLQQLSAEALALAASLTPAPAPTA